MIRAFSHSCVDQECVNILFGDSAGKKQSALVPMAGDKGDPSKLDPSNAINISYDKLPEERRQEFKAELK